MARKHSGAPARKRRRRARRLLVGGAAAGAGFTYLLDPDQGRRRRALVRDKVEHARHSVGDTSEIIVRDSRQRGLGMMAEAQRILRQEEPDEGRIEHLVKARIASISRHPGAIRVRVVDGRVTLTGPILLAEVDAVRAAVSRVPGVQALDDQLDVHETPGDVPALQGEGQTGAGSRPEFLQEHWAPAPRALAGAFGGALLTYGLARRGLIGLGIAAGGGTLLARAVTNQPVRELTGLGVGPDAVRVEKTIRIDAPVEEVWSLWEDFESFPTFMSHVRDVRSLGDGWSHWTVDGPLRTPVEWDAELLELQPYERLAWRSRPGARMQHSGEVALEPAGDGSRVHVHMAYNPALGVAGHALAKLLGADAKKWLDDDLLRMKTLVETGKPPHDAAHA